MNSSSIEIENNGDGLRCAFLALLMSILQATSQTHSITKSAHDIENALVKIGITQTREQSNPRMPSRGDALSFLCSIIGQVIFLIDPNGNPIATFSPDQIDENKIEAFYSLTSNQTKKMLVSSCNMKKGIILIWRDGYHFTGTLDNNETWLSTLCNCVKSRSAQTERNDVLSRIANNNNENVARKIQQSLEDDRNAYEIQQSIKDEKIAREIQQSLEEERIASEIQQSLEDERIAREIQQSLEEERIASEIQQSLEDERIACEIQQSLEDEKQQSLEDERIARKIQQSFENEMQQSLEDERIAREIQQSIEDEMQQLLEDERIAREIQQSLVY
jgi:hypothetical protein